MAQNTVQAVVREGKIELLEKIKLPEGAKLLVTLVSDSDDEAQFWLNASQPALDRIWENEEDNVYAELLTR